ncbi:MAG: ATP-binding protein [Gammaproteobacteria bacterium]
MVVTYGSLVLGVIVIALLSGVALTKLRAPLNRATESGLVIATNLSDLRTVNGKLERMIAQRPARARPDPARFQLAIQQQYHTAMEHATLIESRSPTASTAALVSAQSGIRDTLNTLGQAEVQLTATVQQVKTSDATIAENVDATIRLLREHAGFYFDQQPLTLRKLSELRYNVATLSLHAASAEAARDSINVTDDQNLYASALRRATDLASRLPNYEGKRAVLQALSTLFSLGRETDNLFDRAAKVMELEAQMGQQIDTFREQHAQLEALTDALSRSNGNATVETLLQASQALRRQQLLVVTAAIVFSLAGILVLRRYVFQAVINRLRRLKNTTSRLSSGDLSAHIDVSGNDEITELSSALEGFRDNAQARVKSERALARRTEQLVDLNEELDKFAYIASHDLRSPLHGVDSLASFLQEDLADIMPKESARHVELMRARIRRLQDLLDALLTYSRVGREDHPLELIDIDQLVHDNASLLERSEFQFEYELHAGKAKIMVTPFAQVVRNLVDNAVKHHDRESGKIIVATDIREGKLRLRVTDDGPGIPPEFHDRIFEMFQTLNTRDKTEGSGMGLTFLRKTLAQNGGTIRVDSNPEENRGATFVVNWPLPSDG